MYMYKNLLRGGVTVCLVAGLAGAVLAQQKQMDGARSKQRMLTDQNITNTVENLFDRDSAIDLNRIDVRTHDGVVMLEGEARNLLARTHAERTAETVRGVSAVVNRIRVMPKKDWSAAQLEKRVNAAIAANPATEAYELMIDANDEGMVTLDGSVESWHERTLAGRVTMGVNGVTEVSNQIAVNPKADRPDSEIKSEIVEAMKWNTLVDGRKIDVSVKNGNVTLSGMVPSAAEKREAYAEAWVSGVRSVNMDDLKVSTKMKAWTRAPAYVERTAENIQQAVERAFLYDPRVNSFNVDTYVSENLVTLRGTVPSVKAKRAAAADARNTVGVSRVINRLKVRSPEDIPDTQLAEDVRAALLRDPYVERYDVTVTADDGRVTLTGLVDSFFEKAQAESVASDVTGVTSITNAVRVADVRTPLVYDPYVYDHYVYDYDWYDWDPIYGIRTDAEIREDIKDEMWWSPFVDSDQVNVTVDDGVATLTGVVDSWSEYRSARENALEGGAYRVDNDLIVQ